MTGLRRQVLCLALLATAPLFAGCRTAMLVSAPETRVTGAHIEETTDEGTRVDVRVRLENPNDSPLDLKESRYRLEVEGVGRFASTMLPKRTIAGSGEQSLVFGASFAEPAEKLANAAYTFRARIPYEPPAKLRGVLTESGLPLPEVTARGSGRIAAGK